VVRQFEAGHKKPFALPDRCLGVTCRSLKAEAVDCGILGGETNCEVRGCPSDPAILRPAHSDKHWLGSITSVPAVERPFSVLAT